jgi:hypothetical protein
MKMIHRGAILALVAMAGACREAPDVALVPLRPLAQSNADGE